MVIIANMCVASYARQHACTTYNSKVMQRSPLFFSHQIVLKLFKARYGISICLLNCVTKFCRQVVGNRFIFR